jgi:predicted nuclease of predicted toxin-antitoxin system
MQMATDTAIWEHALRESATIITKDEDFAQRKALTQGSPVVIWVKVADTRRADLRAWFATALPAILPSLERGDTLIELI